MLVVIDALEHLTKQTVTVEGRAVSEALTSRNTCQSDWFSPAEGSVDCLTTDV